MQNVSGHWKRAQQFKLASSEKESGDGKKKGGKYRFIRSKKDYAKFHSHQCEQIQHSIDNLGDDIDKVIL